jgi:hypothetical protein
MKEQNPPLKPSTNPDEYFASNASQSYKESEGDQKANAEQDDLFSGDMTDIEVWLRYKKFKLQKDNEDSERTLREDNATKAYKFSAFWAIFIAIIIVLHATLNDFLNQTEFLFVIGALTTSILTYYLYVIKYLFYRPDNDNYKE